MIQFFLGIIFISGSVFAQVQTTTNATTTSTEQAKPEMKSPWSLSYFNFAATGMNVANYNTPSLSVYQYFAANYKLGATTKVSIRFPFTIVTPGASSPAGDIKGVTSYPGDFHVTYANYELGKLADWNVSGTLYAYFPTTEFSQNKKWIMRNSAWFVFENKLTENWTLSYNSKPEYYWNTQKSYRNEKVKNYVDGTTSTQVFPEANLIGKYDHAIGVSRQFGQNLSLSFDMGFVHEWYQDSQWTTNPLNTDSFKVSPSAFFRVLPALSLLVGMENKTDVRTPRHAFELFREDETSYYVMTFWSIL